VVVHHPDGLQKRIDDRTAYESKAPFLEVLGEAVAQIRAGREALTSRANSDDRLAVDKVPQVLIEGAKLFLNL